MNVDQLMFQTCVGGCFIYFVVPVALILIVVFIIKARRKAKKEIIEKTIATPWLSSVEHCSYKYVHDGYGIAIDIPNKKIYLLSLFNDVSVAKEYNTTDIRKWEYVMPGADRFYGFGRESVGASIGRSIANDNMAKDAMSKTGLWLTVRDIDYPKWFIQFRCETVQDSNTELELSRWMEILRQNINEAQDS